MIPPPVICAAPFDPILFQQAARDLCIDARRFEQLVAERASQLRNSLVHFQPRFLQQYLARQRVAVAMQPAGGNPDQNIARRDGVAIDNLGFFQNADHESAKIIFASGKIAGVFGGLAADQSAACLTAAGRDAAHHRFGDFHVELAAGEIVQEE